MSLKKGNDFARKGEYALALQEYRKIPKNHPLYSWFMH